MGYGRTIAPLALVLSATATAATTEPLTVTRLPDSERELLVPAASDSEPRSNFDEFSRAVSEAVRAEQQSIQARCQSAPAANSSMSARWAWEARCRYQRY